MSNSNGPTRISNNRHIPLRLTSAQRSHFSTIRQLDEMLDLGNRGKEFELFVGYLFEQSGYQVWTTPPTGDGGVDLILVKEKRRYVAQCKQYRPPNRVSPGEVRELPGVRDHEKAEEVILVTTSTISEKSREWTTNKAIRLIEGPQLVRWASRVNHSEGQDFVSPESFPKWLRMFIELAVQTLKRHRRVTTIVAGWFIALIATMWLLGSIFPTASSDSKPATANQAAGRDLPKFSTAQNLPLTSDIHDTVVTPLPTTTPTAPTPTPRSKDVVSSPCYIGQLKGNTTSKFYHEPNWPYYNSFGPNSTIIRCFDNIAEAEAAGYKAGLRPPTPKR